MDWYNKSSYHCNFYIGISADGVYQANGFKETISEDDTSLFLKQVHWDPSHWLNLAVTDVRDGKIGSSKEYFSNFIERTNRFSEALNRGKGKCCFRPEIKAKLMFLF